MAKHKSPFSEQEVVEYIAAHPNCLANHPEILAQCFAAAKPKNLGTDQEKIVDLSPALAARARNEARRLRLAHKSLLSVAAENMVSWKRLHYATLALLTSTNLSELCHVISDEFPAIFDVHRSVLIIESETEMASIEAAGAEAHPAKLINSALQGHTIYLGIPNDAGAALLKSKTPSIALIRLPDQLPDPVSKCFLLLVGNHSASFKPDLGSDLLVLLAEMIGVTLAARLETMVEKR